MISNEIRVVIFWLRSEIATLNYCCLFCKEQCINRLHVCLSFTYTFVLADFLYLKKYIYYLINGNNI